MDERQERGLLIAATKKLEQGEDGRWFVPSQFGHRGTYYTVKPDPVKPHCTCPDFEARQKTCKHLYAVQIVIEREFTDDGRTQTMTETVIVRKSYKQEWSAYNAAQTNEKERFLALLADLCKGIEAPEQANGRPRLPLADMVFASAFKVYAGTSGTRFTTRPERRAQQGLLVQSASLQFDFSLP